jgi:hypothetical protein
MQDWLFGKERNPKAEAAYKTTKNRAEGERRHDEGKAMSGYLGRERFTTGLVSCA